MSGKTARLNAQIHRHLAALILKQARDPRLAAVVISRAELSPDLSVAKVYYQTTQKASADAAAALRDAVGFLRHSLAQKTDMRRVPELKFFPDHQQLWQNEIQHLLEPPAASR